MPVRIPPSGPKAAKIMVVGEAPRTQDVAAGEPFVSSEGRELTNMLHDAGILRTECFLTYVARIAPTQGKVENLYLKNTPKMRLAGEEFRHGMELLAQEIEDVQPNLIIALGDAALWALTNERGITKWRGSIMECQLVPGYKVIPTYSPAAILRKWDWRFIAVQDLRRAEKESHYREIKYPAYNFIVRPEFDVVMKKLDELIERADNCGGRDGRGGHG